MAFFFTFPPLLAVCNRECFLAHGLHPAFQSRSVEMVVLMVQRTSLLRSTAEAMSQMTGPDVNKRVFSSETQTQMSRNYERAPSHSNYSTIPSKYWVWRRRYRVKCTVICFNEWNYVCVPQCIQSTDIKNTLFSEEAHCGCTQLREAASIPRRGCSCSQGASTTKWTHTSLQPGRYRHSATLMNTDGNTWSSLLFYFYFFHLITYTNAHRHPCPLTPFRNQTIVKRPEAGAMLVVQQITCHFSVTKSQPNRGLRDCFVVTCSSCRDVIKV